VNARRAALVIGLVLVMVWALQGGEYGTTDLFRQRARRASLQADVDSLARHVDSLRAYKRAIQTDPALQERIAREEFGMVRGERELLYRFAEADSTSVGGVSAPARDARPRRPSP
jgi:cell division protein FtsB